MGKGKQLFASSLMIAVLLFLSAQIFINYSASPRQITIVEQVEDACTEHDNLVDITNDGIDNLIYSLLTFTHLKAQLPSAMHVCFETPPNPIKIHRTILFRTLKIPQA
ncbi:MAG: hypothetical protein EBU66_09815 [Bacteroidetes bacterium]|nr:hypothetical protein [bacterium]NBP64939.1 hypothetical protein [Bacteroidota bacterium]